MTEADTAETPNKMPAAISREKYWEELTDTQKIERLRDVVVSLSRDNATMSAALVELTVHQHGDDGALLTPFRAHQNVESNMGYARDRTHGLKKEHERNRR